MRLAIVGPGAIGSLAGAYWTKAGLDVTLVARAGRTAERLSSHGVQLSSAAGDFTVHPRVITDAAEIETPDVVFITVKAYDTETALRQHRLLFGPETLVISLQNGMGNVEILQKELGRQRVLAASTINGAYIDEAGILHHVGVGGTNIGEWNGEMSGRLQRIVNVTQCGGFPVSASNSIREILFAKLAINCAINPLTALLRLPNGHVARQPELDALAELAVQEVVKVAQAEAIALDAAALVQKTRDVAELTKDNHSSMLKDVLHGRLTEIDAICGYVSRLGQTHQIATPINDSLMRLVSALQNTVSERVDFP